MKKILRVLSLFSWLRILCVKSYRVKFLAAFILLSLSLFPFELIYPQAVPEKQVIESLEFREVDIKDVLRQLAKQYDLNIVFSEKVSGLITVQLHNVTLEEALSSIITVNGFVYTKRDNVYKVTTPEEAEREGKQTKLFKLNNADAVKLKDTIQKVLTADGKIEADSRSNSIVVTDSLAVINRIESMIPTLDEVTPQVLIEARFIETSLGQTEKLGIDWTVKVAASGSKRPTTLPFTDAIKGTGEKWFPKVQTPNQLQQTTETTTTTTSTTTATDEVLLHRLAAGFPEVDTGTFLFGTLDFSQFQVILNLLKTRTNTKLISSPRVVTLDNKEAKIHVGETIPIPIFTREAETGRWVISGYEDKNVGVTLTVNPQISPNGRIKLKLKPEVSSIIGFTGPTEAQKPITSVRSADTEVAVKDGQTIVIGGLVKNEKTESIKKVPFFGDIPILGLFFTYKQLDPNAKTDLLIFVTARIIKDTNERLVARESVILTSPPRPFKLETREIK